MLNSNEVRDDMQAAITINHKFKWDSVKWDSERICSLIDKADELDQLFVGYDDDKTPLHRAVARGDLYVVKKLVKLITGQHSKTTIKIKKYLDCQDYLNRTPLLYAAFAGDCEMVKILVETGASVDIASSYSLTPLLAAIVDKNCKMVKVLVGAGASVDFATKHGSTPLLLATDRREYGIVKILIAAGASVNLANKDGLTPLLSTIAMRESEMVKILIEAGASVDLASKKGRTPLFSATEFGHSEIVKILIEAGASVDLANKEGLTPLFSAIVWGHCEIVKILKEAGASVEFRDSSGKTLLHYYVASPNAYLWAGSKREEVVRILVDAGVPLDCQDDNGDTPLHNACRPPVSTDRELDFVKALIDCGANVTCKNKQNWTPIHSIVFGGILQMIKTPKKSVQECMKKDVRLIQQCDKDKINEITPESGWDPLNFDFLSGVDIEAWENHMHIVRKIEICPDFYIPSFINIDTRNMLNSQRRMGMKGKGQLITCDVIISKILQDNCDEKKKMSRFL